MEALLIEVIRNSGPLGGFMLVLFLVARSWKQEHEAKLAKVLDVGEQNKKTLDEHGKKLDDHGRRIVHIERSTTTQPISLAEDGA